MTGSGPRPGTAIHPIRVVTARTGLSPELLRAWERRYGVVKPVRGPGGQRLYTDLDVERLTLLHHATNGGRPISQVAGLNLLQLRSTVSEDVASTATSGSGRERILASAFATIESRNAQMLEAVLRRALLSVGAPTFLEEVLAPLMTRVGDAWHAGKLSVAQEHMASGAVYRQLDTLLMELVPSDSAPVVLLSTPLGERHALGALLAAAAAAHDEWRPVWLGPDLSAEEIAAAAKFHQATMVGLSLIAPADIAATRSELVTLRKLLPASMPMCIGGSGVRRLRTLPKGVVEIRDMAHWRTLLTMHAPPGHRSLPPLPRDSH